MPKSISQKSPKKNTKSPKKNTKSPKKNTKSPKSKLLLPIKFRFNVSNILKECIDGKIDEAKELFGKITDVNEKDKDGYTALMIACKYRLFEIVKSLVGKGANVNEKSNSGSTALIYACQSAENLEMVKFLVDNGANINEKEEDGMTSLMIACLYDYFEIVEFLVNKGANVNQKESIGWTAIMFACSKNFFKIVEFLVNKGANVNQKNNFGNTLLIMASSEGYLELVKFLVDKVENVNEKDKDGYTALMLACKYKFFEIVKFLVNKGANVNEKSNSGSTPLIYACQSSENLEVVKFLVDNGANVNVQDNERYIALFYACENNNLEITRFLLSIEDRGQKEYFDEYIRHNFFGQDSEVDYEAPYHIEMSENFVKNQYKPFDFNNPNIQILLSQEPIPHIIYSCSNGHLSSVDDCGVPIKIEKCKGCEEYVGGTHHFLVPGCIIVYHDGYSVSSIWSGKIPIHSYGQYHKLSKIANKIRVELDEAPLPIVEPKDTEELKARLPRAGEQQKGECISCLDDDVDVMYILPCGHHICRECLKISRGGDLTKIDFDEEDKYLDDEYIKHRKCGKHDPPVQFRFRSRK